MGTLATLLLVLTAGGPTGARAAGADAYLLSLSWSPQFCSEPWAKSAPDQCAASRPFAFVLHGLWPQNTWGGHPPPCPPGASTPLPGAVIDRMMPLTPSKRLIQHEWDTHGSCSGLTPDAFFDRAAQAFRGITIPEAYRAPTRPVSTTVAALKADFVAANPGLTAESLAALCRGQDLSELRLCLNPDLKPTACPRDVRDRCGATLVLRPVRGEASK